ncbi:MAG: ThiF family adenylyltransferase [Thermodesulfobacteriota bacterium]|nr:ThiF family adenylyltransferase [Thermodesulfobacteriota bacterium]
MDYSQIYQRNIGLFTEAEQHKLREAKVAVAGVGGVGSYQAVALARFGIGELSIMDPGFFDEPDMNRQYGAMSSTIGLNKATATAPILRDMNPHLKLNVFTGVADTAAEVDAFITGSALVIDAIDYAGFRHKQILHERARAQGMYVLSGPIPGFGATLQIFSPHGMTVEEFYGAPEDVNEWDNFMIPLDRIAPPDAIPQILRDFEQEKIDYISSNAASAQLVGGLLGMEAALMITGKRANKDLITVPEMVYLDLLQRDFVIYNPLT